MYCLSFFIDELLYKRLSFQDRYKTIRLLFLLWWDYWNSGSPVLVLQTYSSIREKFYKRISQHLEDLKDIPLSPTLCLGLINDVSHLLLHHLLLIAGHYIYNCKLRNTIPKVQLYQQLLVTSMKIEKQIALDNNTLNYFEKKWMPLKNALQSQMIN